jgi:hypothetical protein
MSLQGNGDMEKDNMEIDDGINDKNQQDGGEEENAMDQEEQNDRLQPDHKSENSLVSDSAVSSKKRNDQTDDDDNDVRQDNQENDKEEEQEDTVDEEQKVNSDDSSDSDYQEESRKTCKSVSKKCRPFTNGLDLDTVTQNFHYIVEREKEKEFADWTPSPAFLGIIYRWSGKPKFHYFNDIYNCTEVCAVELGYLIFDYIRLCGWIFSRRAKGSIPYPQQEHIEYR